MNMGEKITLSFDARFVTASFHQNDSGALD